MNTEKLTWYAARSGGIIAWLLLALGLILGLLLSSRVLGRKASPAWLLSIHRFLGGLSVIFTVVHVAAIMLDDFVSFGWTDVLVPWASEWNPNAVAWGIIAMYLAIAIELTSFAMRRLPNGLWRGVHWLSAPLFVMATVHGYQAGTDAGRAFIIAIVASCLALAALTVVRVVKARRPTEPKTDPRVLLEEAKARRSKRDGNDSTPQPDSDRRGEPVTTSWQHDSPAPIVVGDHAATPAAAWTDMQPVPQAAATPSRPEAHRPMTDEPVWDNERAATPEVDPTPEPASPAISESPDRPFWEPTEPEPADSPTEAAAPASSAPEPEQPFWVPTEPEAPAAETTTPPVPEPAGAQSEATAPAPIDQTPGPAAPIFEPPTIERPTPAFDRQPVPELEHAGATADPTAPRPAWTEPDALAWLTAEPQHDPTVKRRPGPVPGVWKRSRRDLADYVSDN